MWFATADLCLFMIDIFLSLCLSINAGACYRAHAPSRPTLLRILPPAPTRQRQNVTATTTRHCTAAPTCFRAAALHRALARNTTSRATVAWTTAFHGARAWLKLSNLNPEAGDVVTVARTLPPPFTTFVTNHRFPISEFAPSLHLLPPRHQPLISDSAPCLHLLPPSSPAIDFRFCTLPPGLRFRV